MRLLAVLIVLAVALPLIPVPTASGPPPISTEVDFRFSTPGLEVLPTTEPHVGATVRLVAHVELDWSQVWVKKGVVLDLGGPGNLDRTQTNAPTVLFQDGEYKMWYGGDDSGQLTINYANSSDGVSWTKRGVALSPGPAGESVWLSYPFVLKTASGYSMWYSGYDGSHYRIFLANSSTGVSWTRKGLALDLGPSGGPDGDFVYDPYVLFDGGYRMWYAGSDGTHHRLLYATSADGVAWTRHGIALDLGPPGSQEADHVSAASVVQEGGGYHMWYRGRVDLYDRLFYATSPDGLSWTRRGRILDVGPPGSSDGTNVVFPSVLHLPGKPYQMWYAGRGGTLLTHYAEMTAITFPGTLDVDYYIDRISPETKVGSTTLPVDPDNESMAEVEWAAGPAGRHVVYAVLDPHDTVRESSEDNNTVSLEILVVGGSPEADAGPDVTVGEGETATFDGTGSTDPGGISNYSWDIDVDADSDGDGSSSDDLDGWGPTVSHAYGDDGVYCAQLTVTNVDGFRDADRACVTVRNLSPAITLEAVSSEVVLALRVAGRKWNSVRLELYEEDVLVSEIGIARKPGSPDDQAMTIHGILNLSRIHRAVIRFEPATSHGRPLGASPIWLRVGFAGAPGATLHHVFNVEQSVDQDSDRAIHVEPWTVDLDVLLEGQLVAATLLLTDAGSDDLRLMTDTGLNVVFFNDGVAPDPPRSPGGTFPFEVHVVLHVEFRRGTLVTISVVDDDGGTASVQWRP